MPIPEFKRGDKGDKLTGTVNMDLTGCTTRLLARLKHGTTVFELDHTVTDPVEGVFEHTTDGTLPPDRYVTEFEVTRGDEIFTFPTSTTLPEFIVNRDLG